MKRAVVLSVVVAAGAAAMGVAALRAQQAPAGQAPAGRGGAGGGGGRGGGAPPVINLQLERIRPNLYQLPIFNQSNAPGATTTIFVSENNGVIIVDTKNPGSGQAIIDNVKKITDKPITTIINTHTHNDHVGGNLAFDDKVEIVTQENTLGYMKKLDQFKDNNPANAKGLPDKTFKDKMTLFTGPDAIDLYYFGPSHTGGDALVVFRNLRVMATGDMAAATGTPIIDLDNGGSGLQWGATIAKAAAGIKGVDLITRGHTSQTCDWNCFVETGQFMTAYANAARELKKAGKSIDEATAEIPAKMGPKWKDYFIGLSGRNPGTKANVTAFYQELDKETTK
jgi:cyclase